MCVHRETRVRSCMFRLGNPSGKVFKMEGGSEGDNRSNYVLLQDLLKDRWLPAVTE